MAAVFRALCMSVDSPVSLKAYLLFKYGEHKQLAELEWDPRRYKECDVSVASGDYCCISFLSKWKGLNTGVDTEAEAIRKFKLSETHNLETNRRIRNSRNSVIEPRLAGYLYSAKRKIAELLGPFSLLKVEPHFEWGPGATFDLTRREAQVDHKIAKLPITVSTTAIDLLGSVVARDLHWSYCILGVFPSGPFSFIRGVFAATDACRATTVPKNAKTDRFIAIEPTGNLFLQKGVGGWIRQRLKRVGIDLDDQEVNQTYARMAYEEHLATLDLRAASDSVCRELVYELLPVDWAVFMNTIRSRSVQWEDGSRSTLEKFSSMGNGFTFELESLLFWALGSAVVDENSRGRPFGVYGDDLIVPRECADEVVRLLSWCGFETNGSKSFVDGLFFESCGKHYFVGRDITPCYQKEVLATPAEAIRCHNRLVRWSTRVGLRTDAHRPLYRNTPAALRLCLLPFGVEGDDGFLVDVETFVAEAKAVDKNRGYRSRVLKASPLKRLPGVSEALLALRVRRSFWQPELKPAKASDPDDRRTVRHLTENPPERRTSAEGPIEYGDDIYVDGGDSPTDTPTLGWRWVIPPGVCPISFDKR